MNVENWWTEFQSKDTVSELSEVLNPKQKQVIDLRFGLTDGHCLTLAEVGQKLGICRGRVHQIESMAIRKMRHRHYFIKHKVQERLVEGMGEDGSLIYKKVTA